MRSRFEVFFVLLLLSPSCFSISCRTCRNKDCSEEKILLATCNRNTLILPFQTFIHKNKEDVKYGCLELQYFNGNSITTLKQCIQTGNLDKFCSTIPKTVHVIQCIVKAPNETNLLKILQNNAEQADSAQSTDSFATDREEKMFSLIFPTTLNSPSVKIVAVSSLETHFNTPTTSETHFTTSFPSLFNSKNTNLLKTTNEETGFSLTSTLSYALHNEDNTINEERFNTLKENTHSTEKVDINTLMLRTPLPTIPFSITSSKNTNMFYTASDETYYLSIEFDPNTSTFSPFTTASSNDYYSSTATTTTEERESTDFNTETTNLPARTISESSYTPSYFKNTETTLSYNTTFIDHFKSTMAELTDPTNINLGDLSNEDLLTTTLGSDDTYSSIEFDPNTSTFSPLTTASSNVYYSTATTTTTEERQSTDFNTETTNLPARTISETSYTPNYLKDTETTLSYITITPTDHFKSTITDLTDPTTINLDDLSNEDVLTTTSGSELVDDSNEDLLKTTSRPELVDFSNEDLSTTPGSELVEATNPSTDNNEPLTSSKESHPITESWIVSSKPVSLNTKSPSIEEFDSSTEQSYSTVINKGISSKEDSSANSHTTDSFEEYETTESTDTTLGTSKLPKTVNSAIRIKLSFSIFICGSLRFWFL